MNTENDFGAAKAILHALPLRTLYEMEQAASHDFRCSSSLTEMVERQAEWRVIESVYLARLSSGEKAED